MGRPRLVDKEHPHDGRVYVLDPKHQSFNGHVYHWNQGYYTRSVKKEEHRLHVDVWKYHRGEIPDGYVVHHEHRNPDGSFDKDENNIEWLRLMTHAEHIAYHNQNHALVEKMCPVCKKYFLTDSPLKIYCSDECQAEVNAQRRKKRNREMARRVAEEYNRVVFGKCPSLEAVADDDTETRICPICLKTFKVNVGSEAVTCNDPNCIESFMRIGHTQEHLWQKQFGLKEGLYAFTNKEFGFYIRCLIIGGKLWFIGKDACSSLGYKRSNDAINEHVHFGEKDSININDYVSNGDEKRRPGNPNHLIINLNGLLNLAYSSEMPAAVEFTRWITTVVLPQLLRMNMYPQTSEPELTVEPIT